MSYFESNFEEPFYVVRRQKTGEEDGTPLFTTAPTTDEPYYGLFEEPLSTSSSRNTSGTGTANLKNPRLFCLPTVEVEDTDQIDVAGRRWRIDSLVRPKGLSGTGLCELELTAEGGG